MIFFFETLIRPILALCVISLFTLTLSIGMVVPREISWIQVSLFKIKKRGS